MRRSVLAIALVLAGCGADGDEHGGEPRPENGGTPAPQVHGVTVVQQAGCLACHRLRDEGGDGPGPDLSKVGARLSRAEIATVIREGEPPMPAYSELAEDDFDAVVDYMASLR